MAMFVQFLLFTCVCALGAADEVPPYGDILHSILKAFQTIKENILSMDNNIPHLNDSRRHYAEIIYVVHDEGESENSCVGHDYYEDYQKNINRSAPFAIAHPQKVVDGTKRVIKDIKKSVNKVLKLVMTKQAMQASTSKQDLDKAIDEEINKNLAKYEMSRDVFLALGLLATQLNNNHENHYALQSQNLSAHHFVITGSKVLRKHVMAVKNLYQILYRPGGQEVTC